MSWIYAWLKIPKEDDEEEQQSITRTTRRKTRRTPPPPDLFEHRGGDLEIKTVLHTVTIPKKVLVLLIFLSKLVGGGGEI